VSGDGSAARPAVPSVYECNRIAWAGTTQAVRKQQWLPAEWGE
jgi:hypothetical protein